MRNLIAQLNNKHIQPNTTLLKKCTKMETTIKVIDQTIQDTNLTNKLSNNCLVNEIQSITLNTETDNNCSKDNSISTTNGESNHHKEISLKSDQSKTNDIITKSNDCDSNSDISCNHMNSPNNTKSNQKSKCTHMNSDEIKIGITEDLGGDVEHPTVMTTRNPRLQQEERTLYQDTLLDINSSTLQISENDGNVAHEVLPKNTDDGFNVGGACGGGRLSPSSYTNSSTASNPSSTMSSCENETATVSSSNTVESSAGSSPGETGLLSLVGTTKNTGNTTKNSLESRPIYPNVPYSPYSSPRQRRRPPLRESRRVSIDKSGSFLQLNQYKLMDQIGQGSYGLVKLAYNEEDSTHYAMKILSKRRLLRKAGLMNRGPKKTTQSPLDRVYREIAVLKKLDHPNVVKLIEVLDDPLEDFLYLVFELVHQGEVLTIPTDKPLSEERAWSVFRDALQGLEYLHYQRIIHADIKPGNLLLCENGEVKIADLGVCNEFLGEDAFMNNGSTAGTPAFRAPETLIPGQHMYSGKAADIWALGATLWSLVFGNVPFIATNIPVLYEKIRNDPLIFPDIPKISDSLKNLLENILNKDPSKRLTLPQIKEHLWVTADGKHPLPSEDENCRLVQVNEEDMNAVVKSIPKLDTLILIKTMLKNHSFQHPFARGISKRGVSRLERFTRAGRSNSAPGAYHSQLERQMSTENPLPALCENVASPTSPIAE